MTMLFTLVSEKSVPAESVDLLRAACEARNLPMVVVEGKSFDFDPARKLRPGDLLYNTAVSVAAQRAEQFLYTPGVSTFYSHPAGPYFYTNAQALLVQSVGVRIPQTVYLASGNMALLRRHVETLGGFPVVVKVLGRSSGIGVMIAESMRALKSQIDFVLAQGHNPLLSQFIPDATHWRILALGGRRIASYRNKQVPDDFRSCGTEERAAFDAQPPEDAVRSAIQATAACGLDFAGVDVLEDAAGVSWFLEANFPCYYPHAQLYGGVDVAGQMIDFLIDRAARQSTEDVAEPEAINAHVSRPAVMRKELRSAPYSFLLEDFVDPRDCDRILATALDEAYLADKRVAIKEDDTGRSCELPIRGNALLERLRREIHLAVGMENDFGFTFRFRRYSTGQGHRAHLDEYRMGGRSLVATAILYLEDTIAGGETHFPEAQPAPLRITPRKGTLAVWFTHRPDGSIDPTSRHESLRVEQGTKTTVTYFFYRKGNSGTDPN